MGISPERITMIKQIKIGCKEYTAKNGRKFLGYWCYQADGTTAKLKFRKNVTNQPTEPGHYIMTADTDTINRQLTEYGTVWWVTENPQEIKNDEEPARVDYAADMF